MYIIIPPPPSPTNKQEAVQEGEHNAERLRELQAKFGVVRARMRNMEGSMVPQNSVYSSRTPDILLEPRIFFSNPGYSSQTPDILLEPRIFFSNPSYSSRTPVILLEPRLFQLFFSNPGYSSRTPDILLEPQLFFSNPGYSSRTPDMPPYTSRVVSQTTFELFEPSYRLISETSSTLRIVKGP